MGTFGIRSRQAAGRRPSENWQIAGHTPSSLLAEQWHPPAWPCHPKVARIAGHTPRTGKITRRPCNGVTVYHNEANDEIVGGLIKGVRSGLLQRFPGLQIDIEGNRVKVTCLLQAHAWSIGDPVLQRTYKAMISRPELATLEAELRPA